MKTLLLSLIIIFMYSCAPFTNIHTGVTYTNNTLIYDDYWQPYHTVTVIKPYNYHNYYTPYNYHNNIYNSNKHIHKCTYYGSRKR